MAARLMDEVRRILRSHHYSFETEKSYTQWIRRYILFHNQTDPKDLGASATEDYLSHLALVVNVSASTQNQALSALLISLQESS